MPYDGYLNKGQCLPLHLSVIDICRVKYPSADAAALNVFSSGSISISCRISGSWGFGVLVPDNNCDIALDPSSITIPTVSDGIALGWQAGAALILVGCILFLKKALK